MNKVKLFFISVIIICLCLYMFTEADFTIYIACIFLIYMLSAFFISMISGRNIELLISLPPKAEKNVPLQAAVTIVSRSFVPLIRCDAMLVAENIFVDSKNYAEIRLSSMPYRRKKYEFSIEESYAGRLELSCGELKISDPLGLFIRTERISASARTYIFPSVSELAVTKDALLSYDMESFRYSSVKSGSDLSEVFDIREYRQGDNIKGIHWKLSGKEGEIMVKIPSLPVENSLMIILDKNLRSIPKSDMSMGADALCKAIEHAGELFLSVSDTLIRQGLSHSAGWYDCISDTFVQKNIFSTDDVYSMVPELVSSPFREDKLSGADRYINSDADRKYAAFIYVTDSNEAENEVERLREYGEVYIYRPENFK